MDDVKLGDKVKDQITGFEGIAISRTEYLYGSVRVQVQPVKLGKSGEPQETKVFDEPQLDVLKRAAVKDHRAVVAAHGERDDAAALRRD